MRIVQINCASSGSTGRIARAIHKAAKKEGIESWLMYGTGPKAEEGCQRVGSQLDYRLHTYLGRLSGLHGYYSKGVTRNLLGVLDGINPDIVHVHNLHGDYVNIPLLLKWLKERNKTVVFTLHDCWMFTGGCAHYTLARCERWLRSCGSCTQRNVYPKSYFFDTSRKCLKDKKEWFGQLRNLHIVAVSNWLRNEAKRSFLGAFPIETIYNGIDLDVFHPAKTAIREKIGVPSSKLMVLGVSSNWNDKRKGLNQFVELRQKLPQEYHIVLVGLNDKQMQRMPSGITSLSRTENQRELVELYSTADVFVNVSREETFGLVTAEALACGTPVIVSPDTACPEIIDESCGMIVDTLSIRELSRAIEEMCESLDTRYFPESCENRVRENFSVNKMTSSYLRVYKRICKKNM